MMKILNVASPVKPVLLKIQIDYQRFCLQSATLSATTTELNISTQKFIIYDTMIYARGTLLRELIS